MKIVGIFAFFMIFNAVLAFFNAVFTPVLPVHFVTSGVYTPKTALSSAGCASQSGGIICTQSLPQGGALANILVFGDFYMGVGMLLNFFVGLAFPAYFLMNIVGFNSWSPFLAAIISGPIYYAAFIALVAMISGRNLEE
jgi:hypothetical protein